MSWASAFVKRNGKALVKGAAIATIGLATGGAALPAVAAGASAALKKNAPKLPAAVQGVVDLVAPINAASATRAAQAVAEARRAASPAQPIAAITHAPAAGITVGGRVVPRWVMFAGGGVLLALLVFLAWRRR
jgi:hypothetical protein